VTVNGHASERLIGGKAGPYCFGVEVMLADLCLIPQLVNGRRLGMTLGWQRLLGFKQACLALPAFANAALERQDAR
jgi:maleylpyruvate isomerase